MADAEQTDDEWAAPVVAPNSSTAANDDEWARPIGTAPAQPAAAPAPTSDISRKAQIAGHSLVTGIAGLTDLPGNLLSLAKQATGAPKFVPKNKVEQVLDNIDQAITRPGATISNALGIGMENHPELEPKTKLEKYGSAAIEAVPNAAAIMLSGGGAIPALAISEAGAMAATAAHELKPESKWLPVLAGVVGSLGAGGLVGVAERGIAAWNATKRFTAAEKGLASAEDKLTSAQDAAFAGRDPALGSGRPAEANRLELAQDAAFEGRHSAATAANEVKKSSAEKLQSTAQMTENMIAETEKEAVKKTEEIASTFGKAKTPQEAGEATQTRAKAWYEKDFDKKLEEAKKPLKAALDQKPTAELSDYEGTLNSILEKAPSLQTSLDELTSGLSKNLKKALRPEAEKDAALAELGGVENAAAAQAVAVPVADAMKLRSALGNLMKNPTLLKGTDPTHIDALYAALSKDIGRSLEKVGGSEAWTAYNAESTRLYQFAGNVVSKLIKSGKENQESILPGKAVRNLLSTAKDDGTELAALRAEMPEAADAIAAFALREPGAFAGLSPEAKIALVPDAIKRQSLEVAQTMKGQAEANAKQTLAQAEADHRAIVDATEAGLKEGNFSRLKAVRDAQKAKAKADAEAYQTQREAAYAASKKVRQAQKEAKAAKRELKAAAQAKAEAQPPVNPITQAVDSMKRLASGGAGFYVSPQIMNALGLGSLGPAGQVAIAAGAMALPSVVKGVKSLIKQPGKAAIPITGTQAGANALAPNRAKEK